MKVKLTPMRPGFGMTVTSVHQQIKKKKKIKDLTSPPSIAVSSAINKLTFEEKKIKNHVNN